VVQASNNEAATPARPPRAEVPGVKEESLTPDAAAEDLPVPAAGDPQSSDRSSPAEEAAAVDDTRDGESESEASAALKPVEASGEESDEVVSQTAWRTFTTAPPRLAGQR